MSLFQWPFKPLLVLFAAKFYIEKMTHHVFVYGTLKRNEPNHHWLTNPDNGTSKFIDEALTITKYPLIIATRYNIPFLLYKPGEGHNVLGEIYEVDDQMLGNLDILEDHPKYYVREIDTIQVKSKDKSDQEMKCWVYFIKDFKPHLLNRTFFADYKSLGSHGLPYLDRSKRDPTFKYIDEIR